MGKKRKIKPQDVSNSIRKWNSMNITTRRQYIGEILDKQPKVGGQLASLIVQSKVPVSLVDEATRIIVIMLESVTQANCKLPEITHEMIFAELKNVNAFYSLAESDEVAISNSFSKVPENNLLLGFVIMEIKDSNLLSHPNSLEVVYVIQAICQIIQKKLKNR